MEILERAGILVFCDEALEIFSAGGCSVINNLVKIPAYIAEDAIRSAPSTILLAGRNPARDMVLDGRRVGFTNFGAGVMVIDPFNGELRESTKEDVAATALACDALDEVDIYSSAVVARDVPEGTIDLHEAEAFLSNTSKHCQHIDLTGGAGARKFFEMGSAITGGMDKLRERPIISALVCPTSPLQLHTHTSEIIIECARAGIPVNILSMAMSGASAPVSLAGTLVTHNAEVIGGMVLHQLTAKGAPMIYGSSTTTFDLTYATAPVGAPELGLISAGVAELAHYYMLPSYVAGG
jgi:trimethylamine--corrinoid protein Co-methyltransferase